jgi:hypothetical protein
MDRAKLLEIVRTEFHKHRFDYYHESVPNSVRKNVVPGCTICKVRLHTMGQFVDHLEAKVMAAIEREVSDPSKTVNRPYCLPVALHSKGLASAGADGKILAPLHSPPKEILLHLVK